MTNGIEQFFTEEAGLEFESAFDTPQQFFKPQPDTSEAEAFFSPKEREKPEKIFSEKLATRVASILSFLEGTDVDANFRAIKEQMLVEGKSDALDNFRRKHFDETESIQREMIENAIVDPSIPIQEKINFIELVNNNPEFFEGPDLNRAFVEQLAHISTTETIKDKEAKKLRLDKVDDLVASNQKITYLVNNLAKTLDVSGTEGWKEFGKTLIEPGVGFRFIDPLVKSMPDLLKDVSVSVDIDIANKISGGILPGEVLDAWMKRFRAGSPEFRLQTAEKLTAALSEYSGLIFDESEIEVLDVIFSTLEQLNPTDKEVEIDRWMLNLVGALDTLFIGDVIRMASKGLLRQTKNGTVARMGAEANPSMTAKVVTEAITQKGNNLANAVESSKIELANTHVLAKDRLSNRLAGPDINDSILEKANEIFEEVTHSGLNFDAAAKGRAFERTIKELDERTDEPSVHLSKTILDYDEEGNMIAKAVIGQNSRIGFLTLGRARDAAQSYAEVVKDGATVSFLKRDYPTGRIIEVTPDELKELVGKKVPTPTPQPVKPIFDAAGDIDIGKTTAGLPPVAERNIRLYRASSPTVKFDEVFDVNQLFGFGTDLKGRFYTSDLNYADYFRETLGKDAVIRFIDLPEDFAKTRLVQGNEYVIDLTPKTIPPTPQFGEFFIQIDQRFKPDVVDVGGFRTGDVVGISGLVAKRFDPSANFVRSIVQSGIRATDKFGATRKRFGEILKPFTDLGSRAQKDVLWVINENLPQKGKDGKWLSADEAFDRFEGDREKINGYFSIKNHEDTLWVLNNRRLHQELTTGKWKWMTGKDYDTVAKPLSLEEAQDIEVVGNKIRVYDPDLKARLDFRPEELKEIYENGDSIALLRRYEKDGTDLMDYVLVDKADGYKIKDLPNAVLRYIPGYITQIHDATHLVKKKLKGVRRNGKLIPGKRADKTKAGELLITHMTSPDKVSALRTAKRLEETAEAGEEFVVVEARELRDASYRDAQDLDRLWDDGRMFFSRRTSNIKSVTGELDLINIQDSIRRSSSSVAKHLAFDEWSSVMRQKWMHSYRRFVRREAEGFPRNPADLVDRPKRVDELKEWRDARSLFDYIQTVEGTGVALTTDLLRKFLIWSGDVLAIEKKGPYSKALDLASRVAFKGARIPEQLFSTPKAIAFTKNIAFNPPKQIIMQGMQATVYAGVDHGLKFFFTPGKNGLPWQFSALTSGLLSIDHPRWWSAVAPRASAALGMSVDEYRDFVLAFRRTGLNNISSNLYAGLIAVDPIDIIKTGRGDGRWNVISQTGRSIVNVGQRLARMSRDVGFGAGEMINIQTAFLVAMNRFIKNNPEFTISKVIKNREAIDRVAAEARELSFNMTAAGTTAQTKGALSLFLQFTTHQQKALQAIIPTEISNFPLLGEKGTKFYNETVGKLGSKTFTNREKKRIFLNQLALTGTAGLGLYGLYQRGRDEAGIQVPPLIDVAIRGGIQDMVWHGLLNLGTDEETVSDVSFSRTMAPFSGAISGNPVAVAFELFLGANKEMSDALGASFDASKSILTALNMSKNIMLHSELDLFTERAPLALDNMLRQLPVYNNFVNARFAFATGKLVNNKGNPTVNATASEILTKGVLGLPPEKEIQYKDLLFKELDMFLGEGEIDNELKNAAKASYEFNKTLARRLEGGEVTGSRIVELLEGDSFLLNFIFDDHEMEQIKRYKYEMALRDRQTDGEVFLNKLLTKKVLDGYIYDNARLVNFLRNAEDFRDKDKLIELIDGMTRLDNTVDAD